MYNQTPEPPVNILIVDDRQANIVALEALLSGHGYNLMSATSGSDALKKVLKDDFAVILLDVMMPEMDGFEFARLVRQGGRGETTPIIFLTAIAKDTTFLHRGYGVGAVDYLHKPLDPMIVQAKVAVFVDLFKKNLRIKAQEEQLREIERREAQRQLQDQKHRSERHYKELAESIPQIVWTADPKGRLDYLSGRFFTFTGKDGPEGGIIHGDWHVCHSAMHPSDVLPFVFAFSRATDSGQPLDLECRLKSAEGGYKWHLCRAIQERLDDGTPVAWLGTFTDIDAQKRAEDVQRFLAESSEVLAGTLDHKKAIQELCRQGVPSMADACIVDLIGENGQIERVATAFREDAPSFLAEEVARRTPQAGHAIFALAPALDSGKPSIFPVFDSAWAESAPNDEVRRELVELKLGLLSVPIMTNGRLVGSISILALEGRKLDVNDVYVVTEASRHIAIAVENARLRAEQEKTNRMKDEFLAVLSHELRTPLNTVIGWADLLAQKCQEKSVLKGLKVIERSGRTLAQLVGDLLDVSRIVTGKLELDLRPVDIHQILGDTLEASHLALQKKGITLEQKLATETPIAMADHNRLQQIFSNLIGNAMKFTPSGGSIEVSTEVANHEITVRIADTGIGIQAETLPVIFEAFRQADSSTTRTYGGLGLGLSIVKHLTKLHDGEVRAESDGPGKGAVFTVILPLAVDATAPIEMPRKTAIFAESLAGTTVMVVDDDRESRELVATFLRRGGATVRSVGSVLEALDQIKENRPDVVLTDIGMPDHDGFELLRRLRAYEQESGSRVKAGALTAYASPEDALRVKQAGFELHIAKPVRAKELISAVASLAGTTDLGSRAGQAPVVH